MSLKRKKTAVNKSCNNKKLQSKSEHGIDICPVESRSCNSFSSVHVVCQGDGNVCVCVCVSLCSFPQEYSADVGVEGVGGVRERRARQKREKNRCDAVMLRVGGARQGGGRPRQVAAHVKPLSADSNDTERRLLTRLTQPCVCVCVYQHPFSWCLFMLSVCASILIPCAT